MKTMNPGCNCCGRVLIWDMGLVNPNAHNAIPSVHPSFVDWSTTAEWLGGKVDFALGSPQPAFDFWGPSETEDGSTGSFCLLPVELSSLFDPNTDAVDLGYWSGNIHDYSLVIWHAPYADENLWEDYLNSLGGDCLNDRGPCVTKFHYPDRFNIWGGLPDWWDEVADGTWQGRLVIALAGAPTAGADANPFNLGTSRAFFSRTSTRTALFVNELSAVHAMELDVSKRRTLGQTETCQSIHTDTGAGGIPGTGNFISTTCVAVPNSSVANPVVVDEDDARAALLDGVGQLSDGGGSFLHNLTGGDPLITKTSHFRDFCAEDDVTIDNPPGPGTQTVTFITPAVTEEEHVVAARHAIEKESGRVDFVICLALFLQEPFNATFTDSHRAFTRNLLDAPIPVIGPVIES